MEKQKLILYCRGSTREQLIMQENKMRHYAEENNCEVIAVVFDRRKGKYVKRLKLQWALRLAHKNGAFLVVADLSRISRQPIETAKFAKQLKHRGVHLISVADQQTCDQVGYILTVGTLLKHMANLGKAQ